jgi:tetratricopeptide (TPR) repeat protein
MRRAKYFVGMLILLHAITVAGQSKTELREIFSSAEGDILFEDYAEALPKYLNLLQYYPENYNIYYRIGQCYINTPGEKEKAIPYLETAVSNINTGYKEGKIKENGAPYDAFYYLANAYRINNKLDKAIETYEQFMSNIDTKVYDTAVVNFQIKSCRIAKKMMEKPVYVVERNLGGIINERFSEFDPVVSSDENTIVFTRALQFYDAVFYSKKINGQWTPPVNMTPQLGIDQDYYSASLNSDASTLYLYRTDNYEGNMYLSHYADDRWGNVEKLNDRINTKYWESHATPSHDGKRLYFTSNRKGGFGGLDIYYAEKDSTGDWGTPVNLGPVINSRYNEDTPFLSEDDKTLFFSSRGHYNMGGYDIFKSHRNEKGEWSEPENLGYPVNTTDDDLFFSPVGDGSIGYYAKFSPMGFGRMDIYRYEVFSDSHPRTFFVMGTASIKNLLDIFPQSVRVYAESINDKSISYRTLSDMSSGLYSLKMRHGIYSFTYSADGAENLTKLVELPLTHKGDTIWLDHTTLSNVDFTAELKVLTDTTLAVNTVGPVRFRLIVEPKTLLEISAWSVDSLIQSEKYKLTDSIFDFDFYPRQGDNTLLFYATDRFGNQTSATINVNLSDRGKITPPKYQKIISQKQIESILDLLKKYADDDVKEILNTIDPEKEKFATADDLISYIKEKARNKNISPEIIDRLALEVAIREGVLTQAAVNLMADKSRGEKHDILNNINIYDLKLRSWNDIGNYVDESSSGAFSKEQLRKLAEYILMSPEEGIALIREKSLYAASLTADSALFNEAVKANDTHDYKYSGEWLVGLTNEGGTRGIGSLSTRIKAALAHKPGLSATSLLATLNDNAGDRLKLFLNSIDLRKAKINTPEELIGYLESAVDAGVINERDYNSALATTIINANLTNKEIRDNMQVGGGICLVWWVLILGLLFFFLFFLYRRKKKKDKEEKQ